MTLIETMGVMVALSLILLHTAHNLCWLMWLHIWRDIRPSAIVSVFKLISSGEDNWNTLRLRAFKLSPSTLVRHGE